jgi:hypothetical protein
MTDTGDAPMVPEVGSSRRDTTPQRACDEDGIREDIDALSLETPFVPLVSEKGVVHRRRAVMPNTD